MDNETDCKHIFPKKVEDYIFGDAYKKCLKCLHVINSCEYEEIKRNNKTGLIFNNY